MPQYFLAKNINLPRLPIAIKRVNGNNSTLTFHSHDAIELVLVLQSSEALHWVNGKAHTLQRGDVLLLKPALLHAYENCRNMHIVNILYNPDQLPLPPLDGNELKLFHYFTNSSETVENPEQPMLHLSEEALAAVELLAAMLEEEIESQHPGKNLCAFGTFITLLSKIIQTGGKAEQNENQSPAAPAISYLNLHFAENVRIEKLAKLCHLSRASLFRHFRNLTGCTPKEYQRRKRLESAESMLLTTNKSLSEIAGKCGFCDSNHLAKVFRAQENITPRELRKKA